jgi:ABC-2 type transport system permease protein
MSAATAIPAAPARAASRYRVTFAHLVKSEWIKIRTVRATWWTAAVTVVLMALMALGMAAALNSTASNPDQGAADALTGGVVLTYGFFFAGLSMAVLGALSITGEYSTGMIRSSLSANPTRLPTLWAKTLVTAIVAAVIAIVGIALSYLVALAILSGNDLVPDLGDSAVLRSIGMCILYLVLVSVMAVSVGFLIRHSAGAISAMVGVLFVLWVVMNIITSFLSQQWVQDIANFLPLNLGATMISGNDQGTGLSQGVVIAAMAAWAFIPLIAAAVVLKKRDA